jgi:basic membrane protein A
MSRLASIKLSTLDLAPIRDDGDAAQALHNSLALARHVESLGFERFWVAEHHNMDGIASSATSVLLGYLAAGMSKTKILGTFGGINIPPVTIFMDGFVQGVDHWNSVKNDGVTVLGWNMDTREGLFTNNFDNLDDGRAFAQNLYDEGADIVLPVAGPVGLGSAALADELGVEKLMIIGVDADLYFTDTERQHVYLTSITKRMDATVADVIETTMNGDFQGGVLVGGLENGGVGLAPFHDMEAMVPETLKAELEALRADIIAGTISVSD